LWDNKAQTPEKWKDVYDHFKDYVDSAPTAEDYKGESKTIFAAIKLSLEYGQEESDWVGMENILQTLSLFKYQHPAIVVHLAWSYLQPQGEISRFKMLLDRLIARKLVDDSVLGYPSSEHVLQKSWEFILLRLPELVEEYVSRKLDAIDICNVLEKGSQELFMERKKFLLATFLPICETRHTNLEFALFLGQFYYKKWRDDQLYTLLGTNAENAILLASQPHKKTQRDVDALFHLLNSDKMRTWAAACILAQLADHFYGDDILQYRSIQGLIQNLKHQWKFHDYYYLCAIALKLVKYRTFVERFTIDEDFMEILSNTSIQYLDNDYDGYYLINLLFELSQHKNTFYQIDTKISMKNILKQISSMLIQTIKSSGLDNVYEMLDILL
jgi:hypothetical protein